MCAEIFEKDLANIYNARQTSKRMTPQQYPMDAMDSAVLAECHMQKDVRY